MFNKKTVKDIDLSNKRVLVRVDFNVPLKDGKVADDTRIQAALPTIKYLLENNASVLLCSHLGRPKGVPDMNFSLRPVADYLAGVLERPVIFVDDCIGESAFEEAKNLEPGEVVLLENTRFHAGEKNNDPEMAKKLASLADIFVMDAFGSAHRAHASTVGVADYLPSVAGFLMEKEIKYLGEAIQSPKKPFVAILGGAKVSDKIGVINNLLVISDQVLIGGGMANTFFKAQGYPVGDSLAEDNVLDTAREILENGGSKLRLPVDVVIADKYDENAESEIIAMGPVPEGWRILDIGPETVKAFGKIIENAGTVVWNGPMGVFEFPKFSKGTFGVADAIARSTAISIVGGGDSVAAINQSGNQSEISHISTGGGASLEMLEGKELPGITVLLDK